MPRWLVKGMAATMLSLLAVLLVSPSASAVEPVPPVTPLPAIPSQLAKSVTGSPIADNVLLLMKAMVNAGGSLAPKAITAPTVLSRVAGGTALVGAQLSWAVSSDGTLGAIAMATNTTYEGVYCAQPDWYQAANAFVNLSIAPDCKALALERNADQPLTMTANWSDAYGNSVIISHFASGTRTQYDLTPVRMYCGTTTTASGWTGSWGGNGSATATGSFGATPPCTVGNLGTYYAPYVIRDRVFTRTGYPTTTFRASDITETRADPLRTPRCKVTGGGDTFNALGTPYRESEGIPLSAEGTGCAQAFEDFVSSPGRGPGFLPERIEVESTDEGGAITEIADSPVPDLAPDQKKGLTPGDNKGLVLSRIVGTTVNSCMTWLENCAGWWEASENGIREDLFRCTYGGVVIALAECGAYRYTFDVQTSTPRITDPQTGNQVDWVTGTGGTPGGSVNPGAGIDPSGECFADGWASVANPIEWVLVPVKCALVWAFVPRMTTVETTITALGESAGSVAAVDPLMALVAMLPATGGCGGIPITLTFFGQTATGNLLGACDGFGATAAAVVNGLLTLVVCTGALFAVIRYAAAVFGFIGPGGGFQQQEYSNHMMARSAARGD